MREFLEFAYMHLILQEESLYERVSIICIHALNAPASKTELCELKFIPLAA